MRTCSARSVAESTKSSDERAVPADRLRAHAGERPCTSDGPKLGDIAGGRVHEPSPAPRGAARIAPARHYRRASGRCRATERRASRGLWRARRPRRRAAAIIAVGPQHLAGDVPGQMNAQERQRGVGHRVDERAHELAASRVLSRR